MFILSLPLSISDDYSSVSSTLVFTTGSGLGETQCADIVIVNDDDIESVREQFTVTLEVVNGPVIISPQQASANVTIIDDDGGKFTLSF